MKLQKEVALYPGQEDSTSSRFDLMDDEISLKVSSNDVINSINVSPEGVQIQANRVNIAGAAIFSQYETKADFNSTIASVKASAEGRQQVIYFAKNNRSNPGANTTWVTAATGNGWVNVRPEYNSSTPILWTAVQSQTIDEKTGNTWSTTCDCTTPVVDETTTVIDGGHITTGLISANRIETGKLTIGYFDSSTRSAISNDTYISADTTGITLHPSNTTANKLAINTSGMQLYQNNAQVASFGSSVTLGKTSGVYTNITSSTFNIIDPTKSNRTFRIGYESDDSRIYIRNASASQTNEVMLGNNISWFRSGNSRISVRSQNPGYVYFTVNSTDVLTLRSGSANFAVPIRASSSGIFTYGNDADKLGKVIINQGTVSVGSGNDVSITSVTLGVGVWVVCYQGDFSANNKGYRTIYLKVAGTGRSDSRIRTFSDMSGTNVDLGSSIIVTVTASGIDTTDVVSLIAAQNSGARLSVTGYIKAVKVG